MRSRDLPYVPDSQHSSHYEGSGGHMTGFGNNEQQDDSVAQSALPSSDVHIPHVPDGTSRFQI